jgi:hypothetical protein
MMQGKKQSNAKRRGKVRISVAAQPNIMAGQPCFVAFQPCTKSKVAVMPLESVW